MEVKVIQEAGVTEDLLGLSQSFNNTSTDMMTVATRLAHKGGGQNKFLESMAVWLDVTGPRGWWQQFDTYRVGITKNSESTMHTILKHQFTSEDFECDDMSVALINLLNHFRDTKDWKKLKDHLPESYLQRRIVTTNYKVLQGMEVQRRSHRLPEWQLFLDSVLEGTEYPGFIREGYYGR